jgi:hypothetical protein|tara:strand:- start:2705 stop:2872 length:168 start_codon:yes stop_codon:yes gene_type:complete
MPVALGTRPPEDRASAKGAISGVSKKLVEQKDAKTGEKSVEPQESPIGQIHVKSG